VKGWHAIIWHQDKCRCVISSVKSASVYGFSPFILPYNARAVSEVPGVRKPRTTPQVGRGHFDKVV